MSFQKKKKMRMKIPLKYLMDKWTSITILVVVIGFVTDTHGKSSGLHSEQSAPPAKVQTCREGCLKKVRFIQINF